MSIGKIEDKADMLGAAKEFHKTGLTIYATAGTSAFLTENNIPNTKVYKIGEEGTPALLDIIEQKKVDFIINIPKNYSHEEITDGYKMRRRAIDLNIPLITNVQLARLVVETLKKYSPEDLEITPWKDYM
jgi:carbamoyl-phosphate synthase large subunit